MKESRVSIDDDLVRVQAEQGTAVERTLRWLADVATTLAEVAERIREYAAYLEQLEARSWQLTCDVDNLYMFLQNPAYPIGDLSEESEAGSGDL